MLFSQNYSHILRHEFTKRVERNPRYSLRAFSKFLGISPARLSNVLSGRKGLSEEAALGISKVLEFDPEQTSFFCALVNSQHSRSQEKKIYFTKIVNEYVKRHRTLFMQVNAFEAISDFRHIVLLQLLKIERVEAPLKKNLLKQNEASLEMQSEMIERMIQLGMVEVTDGFYRVIHEVFSGPDQVSSEAIRKFHMQVLDQAKNAIERETFENRDSFFLALPFEQKRFPEVRDRIRAFVGTLIDEYSDKTKADSVYGLSSQFFPFEKVEQEH